MWLQWVLLTFQWVGHLSPATAMCVPIGVDVVLGAAPLLFGQGTHEKPLREP